MKRSIICLWVLLIFATACATTSISGLPQNKPISEKFYTYTLNPNEHNIYVRVNAAIGETLILDFPAGTELTEPITLGDKSILQYEITRPLQIKMWPLLHNGTKEGDMYGLSTTLQFKTKQGAFIIDVVITPPDQSCGRITFTEPASNKTISIFFPDEGFLSSQQSALSRITEVP